MSLTPKTADLVNIDWEDIKFDDSWGEDEDPLNPVEAITVGYLISETPQAIVIGSSYDYQSERWGSRHVFSKAVPKITIIKKGKKA